MNETNNTVEIYLMQYMQCNHVWTLMAGVGRWCSLMQSNGNFPTKEYGYQYISPTSYKNFD